MAGIGDWYTLGEDELKAAFYAAKTAGQDFVVKVQYVTESSSLDFMIELLDICEAAHTVRRDRAAEDLRAIYKRYGNLNIREVFDTSGTFNRESRGTTALLPQEALQQVYAEIEKDNHDAAMAARPFWKKLLGLAP